MHTHPLIEVGVDPSLPICGRSLEYIDRFMERYVERSSHGSYDEPARFYYLSDELTEEICGTVGCAGQGYAYSSSMPHPHELVHVARQQQQLPLSHLFFEEGAAQLHDATVRPPWPDDFAISDALEFRRELPDTLYDQAGHLMSYVKHRYSYAEVEALLDEMVDVTTEVDLEEAFVEALGVGVEVFDSDYRESYPQCHGVGWTEMLVECSDDPLPWVFDENGRGFVERLIPDFACAHPDAVGPKQDRVWANFTFDVDVPGFHLIQVPDISNMLFELGSCDLGCAEGVTLHSTRDDFSMSVDLPVGRHVIRLSRRLDEPGPIGFRVLGPSV